MKSTYDAVAIVVVDGIVTEVSVPSAALKNESTQTTVIVERFTK